MLAGPAEPTHFVVTQCKPGCYSKFWIGHTRICEAPHASNGLVRMHMTVALCVGRYGWAGRGLDYKTCDRVIVGSGSTFRLNTSTGQLHMPSF